jgi:hypothetical protein
MIFQKKLLEFLMQRIIYTYKYYCIRMCIVSDSLNDVCVHAQPSVYLHVSLQPHPGTYAINHSLAAMAEIIGIPSLITGQ